MNDYSKSKQQLVAELAELRQRLAEFEETQNGSRTGMEQERDRAIAILNATIECLPFSFFALGLDGRYMLANAAARLAYGDIVGKTPEEACPNERDLAVWLENNRRAFAGQRVEGNVESKMNGEIRHYHNIITPIRDGR